ncbi:carbohydrate ABC transporter permease [Paenibacillus thalictri]|uniref:Carbohydrate ABC transporter permease n=1 Tax=Paenibacillus thalictri TaxID=2527873 RepID=A0A4Q9DMB5_9BACL|nr:carbohydrate ABC transporter permease [Paenibacillus thalictri]TBL73323.1 carbohydrate ABC transporter permease [Paenibacillus thalictri]
MGIKITGKRNGTDVFLWLAARIFLLLCAVVWLFPFYWGITGSFKTEQAWFAIPPQLFPHDMSFHNYVELFGKTKMDRWFLNSLVVSLGTMTLVCALSCMAGYAFAKLEFRGRNAIFYFMISMMMLPKYVLLVPLFRLIRDLGWFDTYMGLIVPEAAVPFGIFLIRQFMAGIPKELMESARLDGCNEWSAFWRIVIPLSAPAIAALAIFEFVKSWNDYVWQLIIISSDAMKTMPLGVAGLQQENMVQYGKMLAGATLSALPMILVFIAFQKFFTRGITVGAVKG